MYIYMNQYLTEICKDTIKFVNNDILLNKRGQSERFTGYTINRIFNELKFLEKYDTSKINVLNIDCISLSLNLKDKRPLLLNLANKSSIGGGWLHGAIAQEEDIFRCTNYFKLYDYTNIIDTDPVKYTQAYFNSKDVIPLRGVIYTPQVTIFRDKNYKILSKNNYTNIDCLASYAFNLTPNFADEYDENLRQEYMRLANDALSKLNQGADIFNLLDNKYVYDTYQKILNILKIAIIKKHKVLILGALGCGAFSNSNILIAKLFKYILLDLKFKYLFSEIYFSVLDKNPNQDSNFTVFYKFLHNK